tara:strand:- start:2 stop:415 length:414 start_codon:yes stop_codon:yes gene_type:complete
MSLEELIEVSKMLIVNWTNSKVGNISTWFKLFQEIMTAIENDFGEMPGIDKASLAMDEIQILLNMVWKSRTINLDEMEIELLKKGELKSLWVLIDNPSILMFSTSILKKIMNHIDTDDDGEISKKECHSFFCCKLDE